MWLLYRVADFLALFACYVLRYRRKVVLQNLGRSFPEKSPAEIQGIARHFYFNLADVLVETLKTLTISKKSFNKHFLITNPEVFQQHLDQGRSIIGFGSHLCNWEWLLTGCRAHFKEPMMGVYQPLASPAAEKFMLKIRSRFGEGPVPMQHTLREIMRRRHIPSAWGLIADQVPMRKSEKYWTQFLNQDTAFYNGPARIAQKTGHAPVFAHLKRVRRGYYELTFTDLGKFDTPANTFAVTEAYARALEEAIRQSPSDWLWSHKRWKHRRDPAQSPQT